MIKDVMVFLEGAPLDEGGIRQGEAIAVQFGAHLTGLFGVVLPDLLVTIPIESGVAAVEAFIEIENRLKAEADQKLAALRARFERIAVPSEVRRVDANPGTIAAAIAKEARWGDLLIVPRPLDSSGSNLWQDVAEKALFESGRGVFVLPNGPGAHVIPGSIMIAWKDTRECAHAIAEAAPFINQASRVVVASVDPKLQKQGKTVTPEADIAAHLHRLGARSVEVREVTSGGRTVEQALVSEARSMSADLVVMGGYGHSRLREWALGGATRDMLKNCEIPILFAH
jgi:nucleotide-binding universal stress UspA family protein